jgi:hypothetical protein
MLTVKEPIKARKSSYGQYSFQYPDTESAGIILKPGAKIDLLTWVSSDNLRAASVQTGGSIMVVWVDPQDVNDKCDQSA